MTVNFFLRQLIDLHFFRVGSWSLFCSFDWASLFLCMPCFLFLFFWDYWIFERTAISHSLCILASCQGKAFISQLAGNSSISQTFSHLLLSLVSACATVPLTCCSLLFSALSQLWHSPLSGLNQVRQKILLYVDPRQTWMLDAGSIPMFLSWGRSLGMAASYWLLHTMLHRERNTKSMPNTANFSALFIGIHS